MKIARDFILPKKDPSLVLYLPLYELDGASFMSKDAYGHLCTATGALWTPRGRDHDGLDDKISVPHNAALDFAADDFTILGWFYHHSIPDWAEYSAKSLDANNRWLWYWHSDTPLCFSAYVGGATKANYKSTTLVRSAITLNSWYFMELKRTGISLTMSMNGTNIALTTLTAISTNSITNTGNGRIGLAHDGLAGEIWWYKRSLSPLETEFIRLATRWRYQ
jgi:hypothetical protein